MITEKKDNVAVTHPLYDAGAKARETWCDVIAGTERLRQKGKSYLPAFPKESDESWTFRRDTATLQNITRKTLEALCGLVFQRDLTIGEDAPAAFVKLLAENIDNKGNHLNVFARDLFEQSFEGYAAILVDSPTARATDLGEQKTLGLRPYWVRYCADDIINWDYEINAVSKRRELSLIVFREMVTRKSGTFTRESVTQYRVFMLENGRVLWQLWEEQKKDTGTKEIEYILINDGVINNQTAIPVAVVAELGDKPPMLDMTFKNIEHYQTYSDYKSAIHKTNRPLFYSVNLDGEPAALGSDMWFKCNEGGSIGFVEPAGSSFDTTENCLENIKREMGQLGLAMLAGSTGVKGDTTATESMLDSIQETSALQVRALQLKDAIELAMGFTAQYLGDGIDKGGSIALGANWTQIVLSEQKLAMLNTLVSDGNYPLEFLLLKLEEAGELPDDKTAEDAMAAIEAEFKTKPVIDAGIMPNEQTTNETPQGEQAAAAA